MGIAVSDALVLIRKHGRLLTEYDQLVDKHNRNLDKINYLLHILNINEIKLDEFDLIALETVRVVRIIEEEDGDS